MSPTPTCPWHPHVPLTHMSPTPTGPPAHMSPTPTCPQHPHVPDTHMSPTHNFLYIFFWICIFVLLNGWLIWTIILWFNCAAHHMISRKTNYEYSIFHRSKQFWVLEKEITYISYSRQNLKFKLAFHRNMWWAAVLAIIAQGIISTMDIWAILA